MKLIDADALEVVGTVIPNGIDVKGYVEGMEYILNKIDSMPTIEPERLSGRTVYQAGYADGYKAGQAERKTGKWIIDGHHIRCDQCGNTVCNTDREGDAIPREFCGRCGVKMEGVQT